MQPELVGDPLPVHASRLALLRRWAVLLDSAFAIPGIPVRFGLDTGRSALIALVGVVALIPVVIVVYALQNLG